MRIVCAYLLLGLACFALPASACAQAAVAADPVPAKFDLFNGRDFDGLFVYVEDSSVAPGDVWKVEDEIIRCSGVSKGYLRTIHAYADYKFRMEWRWPKAGGNSGLLFHLVNRDTIWPKGFESQLAAGRAGDLSSYVDARSKEELVSRNPTGYSTGRFPRPKPENLEKPVGEWNQMELTAVGDTVSVSVNGVEVNRMTGVMPSAGMIALQSEGTAIDFRNVELELLPPAKDLHAPMPAK